MRESDETCVMEAKTPFIGVSASEPTGKTADPDAELFRLKKLWKKAVREFEKAARLFDAAEQADEEPPIPEAAYCGPRDLQLFLHIHHYYVAAPDGRNWYGGEGAAEFFKHLCERVVPDDPLPEFTVLVRKRANEILAALGEMDLERQRRKEWSGLAAAEKRYDDALEAKAELEGQIVAFRVHTFAGFLVQADLVAYDTERGIDADEVARRIVLALRKTRR